MRILLTSDSFLIRESLENLFKDIIDNPIMNISNTLENVNIDILLAQDLILAEIRENGEKQLEIIKYIKYKSNQTKIIVLDKSNLKSNYEKAVLYSIDGYLLHTGEKEEFVHIVKNILRGNKFYSPEMVKSMVSNNFNKSLNSLTKRESQVLDEMAKGLNNREIANNLYVTEFTVKKHVSNILDKLRLRSRQEVIIFLNENK